VKVGYLGSHLQIEIEADAAEALIIRKLRGNFGFHGFLDTWISEVDGGF
jgi:hypothetical protein